MTEFYENGEDLMRTIAEAKRRSWLLVGAVMSAMAGLLMTIVFQGSRTIDKQRWALQEQLKVANEASDQNRRLRNRVQKASERVSELNEHFLRKTSAELHDGPAQLLGFAALRIGEIRKIRNTKERNAELELIGNTLDTAMKEIRNLSKGLSLPEVDELSVQAIIKRVIRHHEERTKSTVLLSTPKEEIEVSKPVKIAIYRFVQEALNNCWKHAEGSEVSILCKYEENTGQFEIDVVDQGPGFDPHSIETGTEGLGISGLRERTRSIGGELQIVSLPGEGTTLKFNVNLMGNLEMSDQRI